MAAARGFSPSAPMRDLELARKLRAGDAAAFRGLVEGLHQVLVRLARTYVRSDALAEEVVQETWLAVIEGIDRFEGRSTLRTWVSRILVNRARTRAVREARSVPLSALGDKEDAGLDAARFTDGGAWIEPPTAWPSPEKLLLDAETRRHIDAAIATLPEVQRAVITLRDVAGMDAGEVCAVLEVSEGNQRVLLHRARTRVRAYLDRQLDDAGK